MTPIFLYTWEILEASSSILELQVHEDFSQVFVPLLLSRLFLTGCHTTKMGKVLVRHFPLHTPFTTIFLGIEAHLDFGWLPNLLASPLSTSFEWRPWSRNFLGHLFIFNPYPRICFSFREKRREWGRERRREREEEGNKDVRKNHLGCLPKASQPGVKVATCLVEGRMLWSTTWPGAFSGILTSCSLLTLQPLRLWCNCHGYGGKLAPLSLQTVPTSIIYDVNVSFYTKIKFRIF